MEGAFGQDFSGVQAHTGKAGPLADIGARAAASGEQVAFAGAAPDRRLVAHELTHVVQQRGGGAGGVRLDAALTGLGDAVEVEADRVADRVAAGGLAGSVSAQGAGASIARDNDAGAGEVCEAPPACEVRGGGTWHIERGDTLWAIARTTYGSGTYWEDIARANPEKVRRGGDLIIVGDELRLPQLSLSAGEDAGGGGGGSCALTVPEIFAQHVADGDFAAASEALAGMSPEDRAAAAAMADVVAGIPTAFDLPQSIELLDGLGAPTLDVLLAYGEGLLEAAAGVCDAALMDLVARTPGAAYAMRPLFADNAAYADFLHNYQVAPSEQVGAAGFDLAGEQCGTNLIDYDLLVRVLSNFSQAERQEVLLGVRAQGRWEELLSSLGAEHASLIQGWLGEDLGDDTDQSLQERIDAAHNSTRGAATLAGVNRVAAGDTNTPARVTPRIIELLVLGVALPKLEGNNLAQEGVLGQVHAERAAQALIDMPLQEYLRSVMLLELTGDAARLTQSFLVLKSIAARAGRFQDADATNDDVADLEAFADAVREMDQGEAIEATSVVSTQAGTTGLRQQFSMSCAPTAGVTMRAEADPVEALAITTGDALDIDDLGGRVAQETESVLERHKSQNAIARDTSDVTGAVADAILDINAGNAPEITVAADELAAVNDYLAGRPFDQGKYDRGIAAIRQWWAPVQAGYPNDQAMRLVRESVTLVANTGGGSGMSANEIATEYNNDNGMNIDEVTGHQFTNNQNATLGGYRATCPNGVYPAALPANITAQVAALLNTAAADLRQGLDVGFGVLWSRRGGHAMSLTDVRGSGNGATFLVHDNWSGNTAWVTMANFQAANLPGISGNRGLIYRLADPQ